MQRGATLHRVSKAKTTKKAPGKPAKGSGDVNQNAFRLVQEATGQTPKTAPPEKNPAAVALGKLGGAKGGKARAAALSPAKRKAIAKKAARSRWSTPKPQE
jgi:hypothetical protein